MQQIDNQSQKLSAKDDFMRRIHEVKTTRWVRFGVVALLFLAWVAWLGSWWVLIFLPLLFDIYITGYIPFTWWKKSQNKMLVMVMSWVDAIVYALILVYFVFTFIGQNYQIPSSSLEKTLLTGDYLFVSKMSYGPRVPMTPFHFPLVQNTLPFGDTKSYLDNPQWDYHRLSGSRDIKAGDIVVFNFPAGDTIAFAQQNPDYYTLIKYIGDSYIVQNPQVREQYEALDPTAAAEMRNAIGREYIAANPDMFGKVMYRPVDRRENYVKRAVGLPGDKLKIVDGTIYINGVAQPWPEEAQFNYYVQVKQRLNPENWEALGVSVEDRHEVIADDQLKSELGLSGIVYCVPLTNAMIERLEESRNVEKIVKMPAPQGEYMFPEFVSEGWTRADYGELWIPKKGETINLNAQNWPIYERIIRNYEGHTDSYVKDGRVYVDGQPADTYTFAMDYYFMMGDNRDNSLDSRYWGFVPEDHIVGRPMFVLISFDKDKGLFDGKIRWNRIFKNANPGY